jgi:hypothetical protein
MNNDFKIGDLVLNILSSRKAFKIEFIDKYGNCFGNKDCDCAHMEYLTKWIPKKDEWCWFWDNEYNIDLRKFHRYSEEENIYFADNGVVYMSYNFCEPFIGQLPTILQPQSKG